MTPAGFLPQHEHEHERALIGREVELARIGHQLAEARVGHGSTLTVRGEPGVGKTSLVRVATAQATEFQILRCGGVEAEVELPFGGLHELLMPLRPGIAGLEGNQRAALESALAMEAAEPTSIVNVSMGVLSLFAAAASERPLLVVVDDIQWMDDATLLALTFLARRIAHDRIAVLAAGRPGTTAGALPGERLDVVPLPPDRAAELAEAELGRPLTEAAGRAVASATGGNPLAVIETMRLLGDQLDRMGTVLDEPPPPGELIERGFAHRLADLSPATLQALVVVAAALTDSAGVIMAALRELGQPDDALDDAEQQGVIVRSLDSITFAHPLLRSLVYHRATPATLRESNAALARVSADRGSRAWHAAGASAQADEALATALADAAREFRDRGGMLAAARALERAARLSPSALDRAQRLLDAGLSARFAGRTTWARQLLDEAYVTADGDRRLQLRVEAERIPLQAASGSNAGLMERLHRLADEAETVDHHVAADALSMIGTEAILTGDPLAGLKALERLDALPPLTEEMVKLQVAASKVGIRLHYMEADRADLREHARSTADDILASDLYGLVGVALAESLLRLEEFELAARITEVGIRHANGRGDLVALSCALWIDGLDRFLHGDWAGADLALEQAEQHAEAKGLAWHSAAALALLAVVRGARGDASATALVGTVLELGDEHHFSFEPYVSTALGMYELANGNGREAQQHLERARDWAEAAAFLDPAMVPWPVELVEACILAGDIPGAERALAWLDDRAVATGHRRSAASVARLRAVLAGGGPEADELFGHALALQHEVDDPFELARTQLGYGRFLRRAGRRTDARRHLEAAVRAFDRLGAPPWAEQARAELSATGAPTRTDKSGRTLLTSQETAVADLVAQGLTNKQVAAQLFLTPKTIEWHLRQIYRKLGITSRTQLATQISQRSIGSTRSETPA